MGFGSQYVDDMTFGLITNLAGDMDNIENESYQEGRQSGRNASTWVAGYETVSGAGQVYASISSMGPTAATSLGAGFETDGASLVVGACVEVGEAAAAVEGAAVAIHGGVVLVRIKNNPLDKPGKTGGAWGSHSGQVKEINGQKIRIDWESPGENGNVHVTIGNEKYYITDPSDLSGLPKALQKNPWVQKEVQRSFRLMENFEKGLRSK